MAKGRRTTNTGQSTGDPQARIAERAYELYLARGGSDGQDWDDWLTAERELSSREASSSETPNDARREDARNAPRSEHIE
jgi:hypothetical protein